MKTELTTAESQHLISLGVPKEKASHVAVKQIYDFRGNSIKNPKEIIRKSPFRPAVMGFEAFDEHPIFKLDDFLNGEVLPRIYPKENTFFPLTMTQGIYKDTGELYWKAYYDDRYGKELLCGKGEEPIDALYQLTCWYYGEFKK